MIHLSITAPAFTTVPLTISGAWSSGGTDGWLVQGGVGFISNINDQSYLSASIDNGAFSFALNPLIYPAQDGQYFTLELEAAVQNSSSLQPGSAFAEIDPTIIIDPAFLVAHPGVSLQANPGFLTNAVPDSGSPTLLPLPCVVVLVTARQYSKRRCVEARRVRSPRHRFATALPEIR